MHKQNICYDYFLKLKCLKGVTESYLVRVYEVKIHYDINRLY